MIFPLNKVTYKRFTHQKYHGLGHGALPRQGQEPKFKPDKGPQIFAFIFSITIYLFNIAMENPL